MVGPKSIGRIAATIRLTQHYDNSSGNRREGLKCRSRGASEEDPFMADDLEQQQRRLRRRDRVPHGDKGVEGGCFKRSFEQRGLPNPGLRTLGDFNLC